MDDQYVSGDWKVHPGREDEFIAQWTEFTSWSKANIAGARTFVLLRDMRDPRHFTSIGTWDSRDAIDAWRDSAGFAERFTKCRDLCDDFMGTDYTLAASPTLVG